MRGCEDRGGLRFVRIDARCSRDSTAGGVTAIRAYARSCSVVAGGLESVGTVAKSVERILSLGNDGGA
jgi:hypothetical protein